MSRFDWVSAAGGGATRGAFWGVCGAGAGGGTANSSFLRLSGFSLGAFGGTVGAVVSVAPVVGGTDALGATLSRCLLFFWSRVGAGLVGGGTETDGVATGETFSFRLF